MDQRRTDQKRADQRRTDQRRAAQQRRRRRPAQGRRQARRRRKRNLILKTGFLIILIVAAIAAFFLWRRYGPSDEPADRNAYYGIESEGQVAVVVNNEVLEPTAVISDGRAYVEYSTVRDYINSRFYWDPAENILLYTLPTDTVRVDVGASEYTLANQKTGTDYVILRTEGSTAYIALDFIAQYTDMSYEVFTDPDRAVVVTETEEMTAEVKRDTSVRYQAGVKSPVLTEVSKGDTVALIEDEGDWKKVRTQDGYIGYLKKNRLRDEEKTTYDRGFEEQQYTNITKGYTINMAWHNVTNSDANSSVLEMIASTKGLTTISPTWFHVADTAGNLTSIASAEYVNYAHQSNIEVWAAIRDFDGGISSQEESLALLSSTTSRTNLINQLMSAVFQTGVDGINVDFEMISEECGEHYIQFIRELSVQCRKNNIVLSVDNYVPQNYNRQYHREEQGVVADYVVIMGYDEHYGGSPVAGSVASYDFVKAGIENTLADVPAEKVINGVPFFTRVWEETPKTEEEIAAAQGTDAAEYTMNVTSTAYGMAEARSVAEQAGAQITWDETTQQNYATWEANGVTYEVWLEDAQSLEPRLKLMKEYGLAGTAAWRLGQETSDIWELIVQYVN